jgi:hypothetical protein
MLNKCFSYEIKLFGFLALQRLNYKMRIIFILFFAIVISLNSCEKFKMHDIVSGNIKNLKTGEPIRNQEFKLVCKTDKYYDEYFSSTDIDGNYKVKTTSRKDVTYNIFTINNCIYNSKDNSNLEGFPNFYIYEGKLQSNSDLVIQFSNSTSIVDTLILNLYGSKYCIGFSKTIVGPFSTRLAIPILDTVENFCSHKNDGIVERKVYWQFRGKTGNINLTDNYISGVGTIDSLSF